MKKVSFFTFSFSFCCCKIIATYVLLLFLFIEQKQQQNTKKDISWSPKIVCLVGENLSVGGLKSCGSCDNRVMPSLLIFIMSENHDRGDGPTEHLSKIIYNVTWDHNFWYLHEMNWFLMDVC